MSLLDKLTPWSALFENSLGKAIDLIPNKNRKREMEGMLAELKETNAFKTAMEDSSLQKQFIDLSATQMEGMHAILLQEAKSKYWLQCNWRPLSCMMICTTTSFGIFYIFIGGPALAWIQAVCFPELPPVPQMDTDVSFRDVLKLTGGLLGVFGASRFGEKILRKT